MSELVGIEIPPDYGPEHWHCTLIPYSAMGDILARIWSNDRPAERKAIAAEWGCSVTTLKRAIKEYLLSIGGYDPVGYRQAKIERQRESRKRHLERLNAWDKKLRDDGRRIAAQREVSVQQRVRRERDEYRDAVRTARLRDAAFAEATRFR